MYTDRVRAKVLERASSQSDLVGKDQLVRKKDLALGVAEFWGTEYLDGM